MKLPVLGHLSSGEALLSFSSLFQSADLEAEAPSALPRREQARARAAALAARRQVAPAAPAEPPAGGLTDEQVLKAAEDELAALGLQSAHYEQDAEALAAAAAPAQAGPAVAQQAARAAGGRAGEAPAQPQSRPASRSGRGGAEAAPSGLAFPRLPDCVFHPIQQQEWEASVVWNDGSDGGASEHESDDERGPGTQHAQQRVQQHAAAEPAAAPGALESDRAAVPWGRAAPAVDSDDDAGAPEDAALQWLLPHAPLLRFDQAQGQRDEAPELPSVAALRGAGAPAWEQNVALDGGAEAARRLRPRQLWLDLNDRRLIFEQVRQRGGPSAEVAHLLNHSAAVVLQPHPKVSHPSSQLNLLYTCPPPWLSPA